MTIERVWIDHCNVCSMDTDDIDSYPDGLLTCTYMYCGKPFDRPYREDELYFIGRSAYIKNPPEGYIDGD
jgi:hypothetical protein